MDQPIRKRIQSPHRTARLKARTALQRKLRDTFEPLIPRRTAQSAMAPAAQYQYSSGGMAPQPQKPSQPSQPGGQSQQPPKPTDTPQPGKKWLFDESTNSWVQASIAQSGMFSKLVTCPDCGNPVGNPGKTLNGTCRNPCHQKSTTRRSQLDSAKSIGDQIEELEENLSGEAWTHYHSLIEKAVAKVDPDNELSIAEAVNKLPGIQARALLQKLQIPRTASAQKITEPNSYIRIKRDSDTGEWMAAVYVNGKFNDDKTYYTDDQKDARDTGKHMSEQMGIPLKDSSSRSAIRVFSPGSKIGN